MEHPLICTKLSIPKVNNYIERQQLFLRFDQALHAPLVLVSAPAGFGKTTLIAGWAQQSSRHIAWLSLEKQDNYFTRFFTYFIKALQTLYPEIGAYSSSLIKTQHIPSYEDLIVKLINDINGIEQQISLVLDDFHTVESEQILDALTFLIEHAPRNLHIVISSRVDPPIPLARFRGKGKVNEIRSDELRFSNQETRLYLKEIMKVELPDHHLDALVTHTEGWIAGIQMAAVSLRTHPDIEQFFEHFSGTHRYILDYLLDEVFKQQSRDIQDFLLETSILDSFSAELCNYLTNRTNSFEIIKYLEKNNLFIVPLDSDFQWFRYHHLFAEILYTSLKYSRPDKIQQLHQAAGEWFYDRDKPELAISHFIAAKNYDLAAKMLQEVVPSLLQRSEFITIVSWATEIPREYLHKYPHTCVYVATLMLITGKPFEEIMNIFEGCKGSFSNPNSHGDIAAFQSILFALQGKYELSITYAHRALHLLSEKEYFYRTLLLYYLYTLQYFKSGDVTAALDTIETTLIHLKTHTHNPESLPGHLQLLSRQAKLYHLKAELHSAYEICLEILRITEESPGVYLPIAGTAMIELADIHREWNQLDKAYELIQSGIAYNQRWSVLKTIESYIIKTEILYAQDEIDAAKQAIQAAGHLAYTHNTADLDDLWVDIYKSKLQLVMGDTEAANSYLQFQNSNWNHRTEGNYHFNELQQILMVRLHISKGEFQTALTKMSDLIQSARNLQRYHSLLELQILKALALRGLEEHHKAREGLETILPLAAEEGYTRIFLDEGLPMQEILHNMLSKSTGHTQYIHRLLEAFSPDREKQSTHHLLSSRELEVLHLLSQGLSNKEISDRLFISLRTVKWHTGNIYEKLECKNRTEAVHNARTHKIIP